MGFFFPFQIISREPIVLQNNLRLSLLYFYSSEDKMLFSLSGKRTIGSQEHWLEETLESNFLFPLD